MPSVYRKMKTLAELLFQPEPGRPLLNPVMLVANPFALQIVAVTFRVAMQRRVPFVVHFMAG